MTIHLIKSAELSAEVFTAGVPVLGICYGMQAMAQQLGGEVSYADHREFDLRVILRGEDVGQEVGGGARVNRP